MKKVLVTGGGTAGHVVPAMPVIEALRGRGAEVLFVGSDTGLEEGLVAPLGIEFAGIKTGKLRRYASIENILDLFRIPVGIAQAWRIVGRFRPDVVFSKGGYVAFPVVVAAWLRRVPVVAHESDLTPGLANRLSLPFIASLCVNFDETRVGGKRVVVTGTPLRKALLEGDAERARRELHLDGRRPVIVIVGGSLGADRLNTAVRGALPRLLGAFDVVHICGPGKLDPSNEGKAGYIQREYMVEGWGDVLALADLVVSRAGANTLYELLALGKPNILVPLSTAVSRGDQVENAALAERRGFSVVVADEEMSPDALVTEVSVIVRDLESWRERIRAFAARDSVTLVLDELDRACGAGR